MRAKVGPIFALLDYLDGRYIASLPHPPRPGQLLHQIMLAVDPRKAGQGSAHRLIMANLEQGRQRASGGSQSTLTSMQTS